jgi:hypothetical protein
MEQRGFGFRCQKRRRNYRAGAYEVSGNTLTIKKAYLATQPVGALVLTVEFNSGNPATLTIDITDTSPPPIYIPAITPPAYDASVSGGGALPVVVSGSTAAAELGTPRAIRSAAAARWSWSCRRSPASPPIRWVFQ